MLLKMGFSTLKIIVLSDDNIFEKIRNIRETIKDMHLKKVLSEIDMKIESKSRKLIRWAILSQNAVLCYFMLALRYEYS